MSSYNVFIAVILAYLVPIGSTLIGPSTLLLPTFPLHHTLGYPSNLKTRFLKTYLKISLRFSPPILLLPPTIPNPIPFPFLLILYMTTL